jgi:hypothetical protein
MTKARFMAEAVQKRWLNIDNLFAGLKPDPKIPNAVHALKPRGN